MQHPKVIGRGARGAFEFSFGSAKFDGALFLRRCKRCEVMGSQSKLGRRQFSLVVADENIQTPLHSSPGSHVTGQIFYRQTSCTPLSQSNLSIMKSLLI